MKNNILSTIATVVMKAAQFGAGLASAHGAYEPKVPTSLKK